MKVTFSGKTAYQLREHIGEVTGFSRQFDILEQDKQQALNRLLECEGALQIQQDRIASLQAKLHDAEEYEKLTGESRREMVQAGHDKVAELRKEIHAQGENYAQLKRDYDHMLDTCEKLKAELQHYKDIQDDEPSQNKTLFNREYVQKQRDEARNVGWSDGYAEGYAKGRDEQIAEHRQEGVMAKPTAQGEMIRALLAQRIRVRWSEAELSLLFEPDYVCRWGRTTAGVTPLPEPPDTNHTVGIVGKLIERDETVFIWGVFDWTPVGETAIS